MKELNVDVGYKKYPILIKKGLLDELGEELKKIYKGKKIALITDDNVNLYYGDKLSNNLQKFNFEISRIVVPHGEKSKSFDTLLNIYKKLLEYGITRSDLIITLGGGVVGDLGGFAASTFLRGIPFVQIPTSLLAQIDSSIGGKVGIDLPEGKNLVGSFYHPKAVFIDPDVLKTLDKRFLYDGMAEVIKYGCIKNKELFDSLLNYKTEDELFDNIEYIIYTCCDIKRDIVEKDERDTGERMILNFGHTIGHAIESYFNYEKFTHGEAVAIGMYIITKNSELIGITRSGTSEKIKNILCKYNLPFKIKLDDMSKILETIKLDKKNIGGSLNLIVLKEIGDAEIVKYDLKFIEDNLIFR